MFCVIRTSRDHVRWKSWQGPIVFIYRLADRESISKSETGPRCGKAWEPLSQKLCHFQIIISNYSGCWYKSVPLASRYKNKTFNWNSNTTVTEREKEIRRSRSNTEERLTANSIHIRAQALKAVQMNEFLGITPKWYNVLIRNYFIPLTQLTISITVGFKHVYIPLEIQNHWYASQWLNTVKKKTAFCEVAPCSLVGIYSEVLTASSGRWWRQYAPLKRR
jgi:hypothetical protein